MVTRDPMRNHVARDARRRLRAQRRGPYHPWLGLVGGAGWMIALPTVAGALLGRWLDSISLGGARSWTLALMLTGLALGCFAAWQWLRREEHHGDDT